MLLVLSRIRENDFPAAWARMAKAFTCVIGIHTAAIEIKIVTTSKRVNFVGISSMIVEIGSMSRNGFRW